MCVSKRDWQYTHTHAHTSPSIIVALSRWLWWNQVRLIWSYSTHNALLKHVHFVSHAKYTHLYNTLDASSRHVLCYGRIYASSSTFGKICMWMVLVPSNQPFDLVTEVTNPAMGPLLLFIHLFTTFGKLFVIERRLEPTTCHVTTARAHAWQTHFDWSAFGR